MFIKPVTWLGDSRQAVKIFRKWPGTVPVGSLQEFRTGWNPKAGSPCHRSGLGVSEIRIHVNGQFRVIYVAKFSESVYVLHAFQKKARRTPKPDIELARERYRALINERKQR